MLKKYCRCGKKLNINESCSNCRKETNSHYDKFKRNQETKAIYDSTRWRALTKEIKAMYNNLDLWAYYEHNKILNADLVHHIEELKDNFNLAFDTSNLVPLSNASHNEVHRLYITDKEETQRKLRLYMRRWRGA